MTLPPDGSDDSVRGTRAPLPPWSECECFCIHDYAGTRRAPCGWRGLWRDSLADEIPASRRCPRCGGATLIALPPRTALKPP